MLEHGYARWASLWGNSPNPPTQADAAGASVADGFGDPPVFAPGNTSAISSGYRLEQRSLSSGSCTVSDTLSSHNPTFSLSGGYPPYVKWTGGQANVSFDPCPIVLSAPDPAGFPSLGDGTNQFVYDAHQPDGILVVPASANVVGAAPDDMTWALSHVTLPLTPAVPHTLSSKLTISGTSVVVTTVGHYPDPDTATSYPAASYIAKGLPAANSDFGNHVVTLTIDGKASQFANCQTFYTGSASNFPGSLGDEQNWYVYYHPQYPKAAFTVGYDAGTTKPQFLAFTNFYLNDQNQYTIYMEKGTGGGDLEVPTFDINPTADTTLNRNLVRQIGTLRIKGIHRYVWIAAHERGHQKVFQMGGIYTTAVLDASGNHQLPSTPDGDDVLDAWESTHHLNPNVSDTTGAYTYQKFEPEPGDDEVLADVQALQPLMDNKDLWKLDWADFGVQYAGGTKLYWVAKPVATPAVFYWKFTPLVAGNPASGSKIMPFQKGFGTTIGPFGDGTYPIQTLKDLTDQYPSLLTDLPAHE